ncbi:armadillo-type protein [Phakopsora pachyrhizi]|uniref:Armadillo-type protein n=1 Tax=Phakopsora pachyrhizi TaxID=170000 RepID=A0AAV0BK70_PHAPC|nr:armadillo-type protein [Phakopsora pachyrhizi]CAH7686537.1 armadillo-type protein [Phakopsora pachyrhizi]
MVTLSEPFPVLQHVQSSYRHLWFTLQTEFESFNQGNFSRIKPGRTKALLDSLRSIKNLLVGSRSRKLFTVQDPEISQRIYVLTSILEWNGLDDSTNTLKLEAAAIFGLLCISEDHTVYTLLREGLPSAIIDSITAITRDSPIGSILPSQSSTRQTEHHLLRTLLRTLSAVYSIIQDVSSSRKWGYMINSPERIHQPRSNSTSKIQKSSTTISSTFQDREKDGLDMKGKSRALLDESTKQSSTDTFKDTHLSVGEPDSLAQHLRLESKTDELKQACEHAKGLLLNYFTFGHSLIPLLMAISPLSVPAVKTQPPRTLSLSSAADLAVSCFKLTWLLCKDTRRQLWLVKKLMEAPDPLGHHDSLLIGLAECLKSWLSSPHDEAVEYSIRAIGALLSIDESPHYSEDKKLLDYLGRMIWGKEYSDDNNQTSIASFWGYGWEILACRAKDGSPILRSAMATSIVGLAKHFPNIRLRILMFQIHNTIDLIDNDSYSKAVRAETSYALAHAMTISQTLQREATQAKIIPVLKKLLDKASEPAVPYPTPLTMTHNAMLRESAYLALASLMSTMDAPRQEVIDLNLLPSIVKSLQDDSILVRAAACQCCRALSRAVSVLRTKLADEGAGSRLFELAFGPEEGGAEEDESDEDDEDAVEIQLKTVAMGALCNLVLDFSPMKIEVLSRNGIEKFVKLLKSTRYQSLRESALWALKNMTFSSSTQLKSKVISNLGWDDIIRFLEDKNPSIQENVISLLRNVTCGDVVDIDIVFRQLNSESKFLSLMEDRLDSGESTSSSISNGLRESIILQSVYTFSNIATGNEAHKNFLLGRHRIIKSAYELLQHPNSEIRIGAIWFVINMIHFDETTESRVTTKAFKIFESFGFKKRLEGLINDDRSDVRERVGCALNQLLLVQSFVNGDPAHSNTLKISHPYTKE